ARRHYPPLLRHQHRLAEHLPRPVTRDHLRSVDDVDGARDDQVERVGFVAGLVDRLTLGERDLAEEISDLLPLCPSEAAECGPGEQALLAQWTQHDERTSEKSIEVTRAQKLPDKNGAGGQPPRPPISSDIRTGEGGQPSWQRPRCSHAPCSSRG